MNSIFLFGNLIYCCWGLVVVDLLKLGCWSGLTSGVSGLLDALRDDPATDSAASISFLMFFIMRMRNILSLPSV